MKIIRGNPLLKKYVQIRTNQSINISTSIESEVGQCMRSRSSPLHVVFRPPIIVEAGLRLRGIHGGQIATKKFRVVLSELSGGIGPTSFAGGGEKERREKTGVVTITQGER